MGRHTTPRQPELVEVCTGRVRRREIPCHLDLQLQRGTLSGRSRERPATINLQLRLQPRSFQTGRKLTLQRVVPDVEAEVERVVQRQSTPNIGAIRTGRPDAGGDLKLIIPAADPQLQG